MLPGGWKCTPLGASMRIALGRLRQVAGGAPYAAANARVNA
jgi:hypothetical protein